VCRVCRVCVCVCGAHQVGHIVGTSWAHQVRGTSGAHQGHIRGTSGAHQGHIRPGHIRLGTSDRGTSLAGRPDRDHTHTPLRPLFLLFDPRRKHQTCGHMTGYIGYAGAHKSRGTSELWGTSEARGTSRGTSGSVGHIIGHISFGHISRRTSARPYPHTMYVEWILSTRVC
jgi:hypothetical protein